MAEIKNILVTGARGQVGGAVVKALKDGSAEVIAGGTSPENMNMPPGVRTVKIDYEQPDSVASALNAAEGLFLVAPPMDWQAPEKLNPVIDRALDAGVKHVIFNSALGMDQNEDAPLRKIERHLMASGIPYTILRPNFFMENFSSGFIAPMISQGGIFLAAADARTSFISTEDVAAVAAAAFDNGLVGAEYNLTGPSALDHAKVAGIISEVSGKSIQYQALAEEDMLQGARDQGMDEGAIEYMAMLYRAVRNGWLAAVTPDVQSVLGRPPISFGDFAQKNAAAWTQG